MDNNFEKQVSYIKGLADGLELDSSKPEGKLILKMLDVMDKMAEAIDELEDNAEQTNGLLDAMAEDVLRMIKRTDGGGLLDDDDELFGDFDDDDELYEMECPNCHEDVMIEFDMINDDNEIICPNCHKAIPLEFDFDEDFEEE